MSFDNLAKVAYALGVTMSALLDGLEGGTEPNLKSPRPETGGRAVKEAVHRALEAQRLVKRLKLQHAEMNRTIVALEDLPAKDGRQPKVSRGRKSK